MVKDLEKFPSKISTRKASQKVINHLSTRFPSLYGGSADLAQSDCTHMEAYEVIRPPQFRGRNIKYGIREFAMGSMAVGMATLGAITPFVGTFLVFSDYMRHVFRMAAMMKSQVIFQLTHDSIWVGEDGPTHQPIEHLASLRSIPHLHVIRPADAHETKMAWIAALHYQGPTALILSRHPLPTLKETACVFEKGVGKGAYFIKEKSHDGAGITLVATGSEVSLALNVAEDLKAHGYSASVVSMPCFELFERQSNTYRESLLPEKDLIVSIEAGASFGWHKYVGKKGLTISLDEFGESGSISYLAEKFGFTVEAITAKILCSFKGTKKDHDGR